MFFSVSVFNSDNETYKQNYSRVVVPTHTMLARYLGDAVSSGDVSVIGRAGDAGGRPAQGHL